MPTAAQWRMFCSKLAISRSRVGLPSLMSSCTGTLSTTSNLSPAASMRSRNACSFSTGHTSPTGTS